MIRRACSLIVALVLLSTLALTAGCDEWLTNLARENIGAFIVDVVQTGVDATVNP